jgi:hypothetical protein
MDYTNLGSGDIELPITLRWKVKSRKVNVLYTLHSSVITQIQLTVGFTIWFLPYKGMTIAKQCMYQHINLSVPESHVLVSYNNVMSNVRSFEEGMQVSSPNNQDDAAVNGSLASRRLSSKPVNTTESVSLGLNLRSAEGTRSSSCRVRARSPTFGEWGSTRDLGIAGQIRSNSKHGCFKADATNYIRESRRLTQML